MRYGGLGWWSFISRATGGRSLDPPSFSVPVQDAAETVKRDRIQAEQCWIEDAGRGHQDQGQVILQVDVAHLQAGSTVRGALALYPGHNPCTREVEGMSCSCLPNGPTQDLALQHDL